MNRIVDSWNRHEQKPKYDGPDTVTFDEGEILILPDIEGEKLEVKRMAHPNRKVSINEDSVKELALHGSQEGVETLFRETFRALKRLKEVAGPRTRIFRRMARQQSGHVNLHDLILWMDGLVSGNEKFAEDIVFLKRLHVTLGSRVHLPVIKEIEG